MERETVLVASLAGLTEGSLEEFTKVKAQRGEVSCGSQPWGSVVEMEGTCVTGPSFLSPINLAVFGCHGLTAAIPSQKVLRSLQASSSLGLQENPLGSNPGSAIN